ncbi:MAG: hypothetical protein ABR879_04095 [Methanomassiliicoccales archaeon]|jgi:lipoate-protein ligase A
MGGRPVERRKRLVEKKVRGGKLFRIRLQFEDGVVHNAVLTGDFFLEPEEGLENLEAALPGAYAAKDAEAAKGLIDEASRNLTITGFSSSDLVDALKEAGGCRGG